MTQSQSIGAIAQALVAAHAEMPAELRTACAVVEKCMRQLGNGFQIKFNEGYVRLIGGTKGIRIWKEAATLFEALSVDVPTEMYLCAKCGELKPEYGFARAKHLPRGRSYLCKICKKAYDIAYRDVSAEANKQRASYSYAKNRDKRLRYYKEYAIKNKHKRQAKDKVRWALFKGRLTKGPCEVCGALKVQAHHNDYSKPLEVKWLCPRHHQRLHHE